VVVLLSPDEMAYLKAQFCRSDERSTEGKPQGQPRPNVLFEAGLALGAHHEKTLLVQVGKVRQFSDLAGKHLVRLSDETSKRIELAERLARLGCKIDRRGSDWTTAGHFVPTEPAAKRKPARKER
jgi:predicted nucleotide-binding protein